MHANLRTPALAALAAAIIIAGAPAPSTWAGHGEKVAAIDSAATLMVGTWELNRDLSEIPAPPRGERPQGPPPDAGGAMGGPPPGDSSAHPEGGPGGPPPGHGPLGGADTLTIVISGSDLSITSDDGRVRLITPSGQPVERRKRRMTVTETARWDSGALVIESVGARGPKITETYALVTDGTDRLVHTMTMPRPDSEEAAVVKLVYDRSIAGD